jgi:transketolase
MTTIEGGNSFLPAASAMKNADPYGRIIHFGIREHAMGSILNGIALHGLSRPFAGTFAVFSDYMRPSVRLAAIMDIPSTFVWTHDSIGVGEDGPTHQPIEHFAALRAIPNFAVIRPADANEVTEAWKSVIKRNKPAGFLLFVKIYAPLMATTHGGAFGRCLQDADILKDSSSAALKSDHHWEPVLKLESHLMQRIALEAEGVATTRRRQRSIVLNGLTSNHSPIVNQYCPPQHFASASRQESLSGGVNMSETHRCHRFSSIYWGASASANKLYTEFGLTSEAVVGDVERRPLLNENFRFFPCSS